MRTSYSALSTYKSCPLKYKHQEIDKIKVPKSKEAVFGAAMHEALRFCFQKNPLYPTLAEIINFFKENFSSRAEKTGLEGEERQIYEEEGAEIIEKFYKKNQPWNFNAVDMESRFNFSVRDDVAKEEHIIAGIIDRLDKIDDAESGMYEIIDYKTAGRMPSQNSVDNDLQMSIYHLGILRRWPFLNPKNIKLSLYFLKHNEKISTLRDALDTEKTEKTLLSLINEILARQEKNDFSPTPSALCGWCGYKQICPMWKHEYDKVKSPNSKVKSEEINEIINEYIDLKIGEQKNKKRLAELQTLLHEFMDSEQVERIFGKNEYITRKIKEAIKYELEKVREILEPLGMFKEILKIDETLLNKIIAKLPEGTKRKFEEIVKETKITKTLTISKIKLH